jgi:hypothetical protein
LKTGEANLVYWGSKKYIIIINERKQKQKREKTSLNTNTKMLIVLGEAFVMLNKFSKQFYETL